MSHQPLSHFNVTAANLRGYDWQTRLIEHPNKDCSSYTTLLIAGARECKASNDDLGSRVYSLLYTIASFHADFDWKGNPFRPLMNGINGKRSLMAEDLREGDLDALRGVFEEITDPEFRARVGDILWECRRDYKAAQAAVSAYLDSAEFHKTEDLWPSYTERVERAALLAAKLGFGKGLHQQVLAVVEAAITQFERNLKSGLLCHHLISIALYHESSHIATYAAIAEWFAGEYESLGEFNFSHRYWSLAEHCYRVSKNKEDARRCELAAAEALISMAEKGAAQPQFGFRYSAHWLGKGLEALRQAQGDPGRITEIHRRFLDAEKLSLDEMTPLDIDFNQIPGFRDTEEKAKRASAAHVQGHTFNDALARFVHVTLPTDLVALRLQMENQSKGFIADKIMGLEVYDHSGKVADRLNPVGHGTEEEEAIAERKRMVQTAKEINWQMQVVWKIEPARIAIISEHSVRRSDLISFVTNNAFIPPGHEGIYLRGFQSGFFGDWLVSMHLLIPQIEASLRLVLQQYGIVTSTLEQDGTQKERDLNQILWMKELEQIFEPGVLFDLRGILIERFGFNLRNESAHGLTPEAGFYQPAAPYLWWLMLRLCWIGKHMAERPLVAQTCSQDTGNG